MRLDRYAMCSVQYIVCIPYDSDTHASCYDNDTFVRPAGGSCYAEVHRGPLD